MARGNSMNEMNFQLSRFSSEDEFKAKTMSYHIRAPKVNTSIRDKSCIISFPRGTHENKLTRLSVREIMIKYWGANLFDHVKAFGNIDFSRKWIFTFDTEENNDLAVSKDIFINGIRVKLNHATKKFNVIKIDWVPTFLELEDLIEIINGVDGISGKLVDARWARGMAYLKIHVRSS